MIDDYTATRYYNELETASGADKDRMLRDLSEYADYRDKEDAKAKEEHIEKLYTDPAYFAQFANSDSMRQAEDASMTPTETRHQVVNRVYLDTLAGRELELDEYDQIRNSYAREHFGKPEINEKEFFDNVTGEFEFVQKKRLGASDLYTQAVKHVFDDAMAGTLTPFTDKFAKWKEANKELLDDEQDMPYMEGMLRVYDNTKKDILELGPAGPRIRDVVTRFTQGAAGEEDLQVLGRELIGLSKEQRDKVYHYAALAAQADKKGMGNIEQLALSLGQSVSRSFDFLGLSELKAESKRGFSTIGDIERAGRLRLQQLERKPDSPEKAAEIAAIHENFAMAKIVRELKDLAKTQIDPIKPIMPEGTWLGTAERGIYGLGGSVGTMAAMAINPALGYLAIAGQEYENLRTEYPDLDPNVAGATALASAALQAPIEYLQVSRLRGIPLTGQVMHDIRSTIIGTGLRVTRDVGIQNVQEGMQDAISAGIPQVLAALRTDMPQADPEKAFKDYLKQRGEVFFAVLPLGLVGGGMASLNDYAKGGQDLIAKEALKIAGYSEKQANTVIAAPPEQRDAVIQATWAERTPENIAKGAAKYEKNLDAAQKLQADPEMPTLERTPLPDGSIEYRVLRTAPAEVDPAKHVTVRTSAVPETGEFEAKSVPVAEAYRDVNRNINSYRAVVDCLVGK